jgi:hypothetical protein
MPGLGAVMVGKPAVRLAGKKHRSLKDLLVVLLI